MCASAGMSIFNKLALLHIPLPLTIVAIQMAFTTVTLLLRPSELRWGNSDDIKRWAYTVPLLFVGMLASSMVAMQFASLGTMVVCRNIAPIPTMLIEGMFRIPYVMTARTLLSLAVIIGGVALYEIHEIRFSVGALLAILVNMLFAVLERIMQRHLMANNPVELSKPMMMMLNNGIGMLPTLLLALCWGEQHKWADAFSQMDKRDMTFLAISCLNGLAISYAGIRLQHMVAATSFMVVTNVNKFAVIFFGIATLGESASYASLLGCSLAVVGGVMYADARKRADESPMRDMHDEEKSLVKRAALGGDADLDSGDEDEPE
ncbi:hypothetical protein T492DRAFT_973675 [Pavlovales sp. CCMP2436]|nr:hypothetical protein T492DRAFT_973675 [Pavlovales sp. CCMP2436]